MGYTNKDKRLVNVSAKDKRRVRHLRRRAERREVREEHVRQAGRALRRGWWYA